jgi:hypothetical protein
MDSIELRADPAGNRLVGYAAVYGSPSEDLGGFIEIIRRGAFADVIQDDCRCLINHDPNLVLGRTKAGTLRLRDDQLGLAIDCDLPSTYFARALVTSMERGDVGEMSFSFVVATDRWYNVGQQTFREIIKFERLYDVAVVTYPAYAATSVAVRGPVIPGLEMKKRRLELADREFQFGRARGAGGSAIPHNLRMARRRLELTEHEFERTHGGKKS